MTWPPEQPRQPPQGRPGQDPRYPPPPPLEFETPTEAWRQPEEKKNGLALAAFILSLIALIPISVVLGIIALIRSRERGGGGRGLAVASLVISALWAVVIVGGVALSMRASEGTSATELKVGDCYAELPKGKRVSTVDTVSCDQPHKAEVYALLTLPEGPFPAKDVLSDHGNKCGGELKNYAGAAADDPAIGILVILPTPESWADGDRAFACVAVSQNSRAGSIKA